MDKVKILRDCNRIEEIVTDAYNQHRGLNYYELKEVLKKTRSIGSEVSEKPKTNADRIRQMTDEELADILCFADCETGKVKCPAIDNQHCNGDCCGHFLRWLKQEASEDAGSKTDEAEPVRRGRWIVHTTWHGMFGLIHSECSECKFDRNGDLSSWKFCPDCGARMDGGADNG